MTPPKPGARYRKRGAPHLTDRFPGPTLSERYPHLMLPIARIELTKGQHTVIDPEDLELASQYNWHVTIDKKRPAYPYYAITAIPHPSGRMKPGTKRLAQTTLRLHELIMGAKGVDHVNGNGLDNRRVNLRLATAAQNMANVGRKQGRRESLSSRFKGVSWNQGKWMVTICRDGKNVNLGRFRDEVEAARTYDAAALELWGEFARTNVTLGLLPEIRRDGEPLTLFDEAS